jgi:GNAT superfamily N-acetyltransferase
MNNKSIIPMEDVKMLEYKGLCFEELKEEDIKLLTPVMTRAFNEDAKIHLNEEKGGPEGYDNGDFLRKYGLHKDSDAYKITSGDSVIGCVIVWINKKTKENFLGCIFTDTCFQNKGYGRLIWEFIEQQYPDTKKWRTETPAYSRRNHNFYVNKCGFHIVHINNPMSATEGFYLFEKAM